MHNYTRVEGWTHDENYRPRKVVGLLGPDRRFEGKLRYTIAAIMMFVAELGKMVAIDIRFLKICQMAAG